MQRKILRDFLTGEGRERVEGFLPRTWRFRLQVTAPPRPCKLQLAGRPLRLCLPANKLRDSGADAHSAPEFKSLRVAKESTGPKQIWSHRKSRDSFYSVLMSSPIRLLKEIADGKLVSGVRRS